MSKWFRLLTLKECFQLLIYKFGVKIIHSSGYDNYCKAVSLDLQELLAKGYNITRKGKAICINGIDPNDSFKYFIRPGTADKKVFYQVIIENEYMPMINIIKNKATGSSINNIVDAGSNIGMTILFFNKFFPDANIISIEPDDDNFTHQEKNIKINSLNKSVRLLKNALWKNNTDQLAISNNFRDGDSWAKSVTLENTNNSPFIKAITIKDIKNQFGKDSIIDLLKIDIEGAEAELFKDAEFIQVLKESVKFLCLEIHDELNIRQNIYKIFSEINFSFQENGETCFCVNNNLN